jgi:Ca2+-binding RTX toxin-like protein
LLSGNDTFIGNAGNDILNGHGGADFLVGNGGNDTFVLSDNVTSSTAIHGSAADGSGGFGETDTIRVGDGIFQLDATNFTDIDRIVYSGTDNGILALANVLGSDLANASITGSTGMNQLVLNTTMPEGVFNYSSLSFSNWTAGTDVVAIRDTAGDDTITGTGVSDIIFSSGGNDRIVGLGGNDVFVLSSSDNPLALHGANADGSGGAGEINLIRSQDFSHYLTNTVLTNIDGFYFNGHVVFQFDPTTGAATNVGTRVLTFDADQFGTGIANDAVVIGDPVYFGANVAVRVLDANNFSAAAWQPVGLGPVSTLHVSGTLDNDTVTGWSMIDVMALGAGNDTASGGAGNDFIFGEIGNDTASGGTGNDILHGGANNDKLFGSSGNDRLFGDEGIDVLNGGRGKDFLFGGADRDLFDFNSIKDSVRGSKRDAIYDFKRGVDDIDLRTIDAKKGVSGNQKFKWIGKQDFHDKKGELRFDDKGSKVVVQGDVNGDGKADFEILVKVGALNAHDFLL